MNTKMNTTPFILEKSTEHLQSVDIFSKLLSQRIVFIGEEIESSMANTIVAQLLYLNSISNNHITMYINSYGGSVHAGMAIYDTMQWIKAPVKTVCLGTACSMAATLLMAGEKGMRSSLKNSRIMIHQPLGGSYGQTTDVLIAAKELELTKLNIQ